MTLNIIDDAISQLNNIIDAIVNVFNSLVGNSVSSLMLFITAMCFLVLLLNLLVGKK